MSGQLLSEYDRFLNTCKDCAEESAVRSKRLYVRRDPLDWDQFIISRDSSAGWLFVAYPGGRKVFSITGARLADMAE